MLPMYYPGVTEASMATPITISPGADVTGIDVIVRPEPVTTIEVTIDAPARRASESRDHQILTRQSGRTAGRAGRCCREPAGLSRVDEGGTLSDRGCGERLVCTAWPPRLLMHPAVNGFWGSAEVSTDGMTPSSITISLQPSARVTGTVIFEGRATPQLPFTPTLDAVLVPARRRTDVSSMIHVGGDRTG